MYNCLKCGKKIESKDELGRIRCPFCGHKVLAKERADIVKVVRAR